MNIMNSMTPVDAIIFIIIMLLYLAIVSYCVYLFRSANSPDKNDYVEV